MAQTFSQEHLQAIAESLGDTSDGLTGSEIGHLLKSSKIPDVDPQNTKWVRLFNAFVNIQNTMQNRLHIIAFIRKTMKPQRFIKYPERFEIIRTNLNTALAFAGMFINDSGELKSSEKVTTISDAQKRARGLRTNLENRGTHPDVLKFCRAELLNDNYFHAVLEATKSVAEKIRIKTGIDEDGAALIDKCFSGNVPLIAINLLSTSSQRSEQKGFANLLKGVFGMFRNTTAHTPKISWDLDKEDAEDLLTTVSLIHRRLDKSYVTSY